MIICIIKFKFVELCVYNVLFIFRTLIWHDITFLLTATHRTNYTTTTKATTKVAVLLCPRPSTRLIALIIPCSQHPVCLQILQWTPWLCLFYKHISPRISKLWKNTPHIAVTEIYPVASFTLFFPSASHRTTAKLTKTSQTNGCPDPRRRQSEMVANGVAQGRRKEKKIFSHPRARFTSCL